MKSRTASFFETLVSIMIVLVVVQTLVEDLTVVAMYPARARMAASLAGFLFDLFFTIEFLVRLSLAMRRGAVGEYFTKERGWIDFLASVPLLAFSSGPAALARLFGSSTMLELGSLLNLLKVIKAIRIARILRLLRIAKIFRSIKYAQSPMAQRHVANATALSITTLVAFLMLFSSLVTFVDMPGLESGFAARPAMVMRELGSAAGSSQELANTIGHVSATDPALLLVKHNGTTLFSRYDNEYYATGFASGDYAYTRAEVAGGGLLELFYDLRPYSVHMGRESIMYLLLVIALVLAFTVIYSPHFVMTVTDPIHVMNRGMGEGSYNLAVRIPERYADDDVFVLARNYNETFLPMKDLSAPDRRESVLDLQSADIRSLLEAGEEAPPEG